MVSAMRVRASSIVEVIVALVIILLVFGSSTLIYLKLIHHRPEKSYRLQKELSALASEIKKEYRSVNNEEYESESGIHIIQYCQPYKGDSLLLHLKLEAVDNGRVVAVHEELFRQDKDGL